MKRITWFLLLSAFCGFSFADTAAIINKNNQKITEDINSELRIKKTVAATDKALEDYRETLARIENLKQYNAQLQAQIDYQKQQMITLDESLLNASKMEREIGPLTVEMIDSLSQFIALDMPFLLAERYQRITFLRDNVKNPNVTTAEKLRQALDAYLIEVRYGNSLNAYVDTIMIDNEERDASILQVGRIALLFQTTDKSLSGYWHKEAKRWEVMDDYSFRRSLELGLKIAREQATTELIAVPVPAPIAAKISTENNQ